MAVETLLGFETRSVTTEGITLGGTSSISQTQARTGTSSLRCNPGSGASGYVDLGIPTGTYDGWGLYIATLPSVERTIRGSGSVARVGLRSDGKLSVYNGSNTLIGTSTTALTTGQWYWIGTRSEAISSVALLQINGVDEVSGTQTDQFSGAYGCIGTEASAIDVYIDDIIRLNTGFLAPSKVGLLLPTADSAGGTGWVLGTGTALGGNGWVAVDNTPPVGVADLAAGSDVKQIRNATAAANSNYDATMTTYTAAGVGESDSVLAIRPIVVTAAPVSTSAKQGTVGVASNPAIANIALGAGGTAGAFWSGVAGGTYPTGWKVSFGTLTDAPSVTVGTAPVMRVTQVTSSTRIAVVCFMGIQVAWTPAAAGGTDTPFPMTGGGYYGGFAALRRLWQGWRRGQGGILVPQM